MKPDDDGGRFKGRMLIVTVVFAGSLVMALVAQWLGRL
jgi:hypothetical protein